MPRGAGGAARDRWAKLFECSARSSLASMVPAPEPADEGSSESVQKAATPNVVVPNRLNLLDVRQYSAWAAGPPARFGSTIAESI